MSSRWSTRRGGVSADRAVLPAAPVKEFASPAQLAAGLPKRAFRTFLSAGRGHSSDERLAVRVFYSGRRGAVAVRVDTDDPDRLSRPRAAIPSMRASELVDLARPGCER